MLSALEVQEEAKRATNAGRHERALALVERGRRLTGDPDLLALLDGTAAYAEVERGHLAVARELCDAALARVASDPVRGIILGQRGVVLTRQGQVDAALADFDAAVQRLSARPEYRGRFLLNRGNLHLERGEVVAAGQDYAGAVAAFEEAGLATQRAKAENNVGYVLMLTGDLVGALAAMARARRHLAGLSPVSRAIGLIDHAEALFLAGLASEGEAELRGAIDLLTRARARRPAADARYALARHLAADDPRTAARLAGVAGRAFRVMGAERAALSAEALALACRLALGRPVEADALAMVADLDARGLRVDRDHLTLRVYAARLASGRVDAVRGLRLPRPELLRDRILAAEVAARRAAAVGRPGAALAHLRVALDEAQAVRARVGSLDLATTLSNRTRSLSQQGLELAVASGDPELVLEWSERGRAHASRLVPVRPGQDAATVDSLAELRHLALAGGDPQRMAALRRQVRESAWRSSGAGVALQVCSPDALRAALDDQGAALVAHLVVGGRVVALVVADTIGTVDCGPAGALPDLLAGLAADLDAAASRLGGVRRAVRGSLDAALGLLDGLLVAPVLGRVGRRSLVLTPSDPLHLVPWGCLPGLAGRPTTVPRSATAWLADRTAPRPAGAPSGPRVVAISGPGLPGADAEASAVGALWPGARVLSGTDATAAAVLAALGAADIGHVAAHGRHWPENPLFSRLELADGPLFGYDLDALDTAPDLVVLSACDVGVGTARGDDVLGLPTALLHAGVRTVIASVARVGDEAARAASEALHAGLRRGLAPAAALAAAAGPPASAHVAPFVCFGAG